jgi:tRNA (guanine-N7-)-methyltransferase
MVKSCAMKGTDLKHPFSWEERQPVLHQGVFFVPKFYDQHKLRNPPLWEDSKKPVFIEYCSGNGAWILQKALHGCDAYWVAVEQKFERVRKIWKKMHNLNVRNLLVVSGEARTFTTHYLPDACVDGIFINFPDPWPKTKHAKNRLVQEPFVSELARVLKAGGKATFVTDHALYCQQIIAAMQGHASFQPDFPAPYFVTEWADYGTSYFESLWKSKGLTIHYMVFEKR